MECVYKEICVIFVYQEKKSSFFSPEVFSFSRTYKAIVESNTWMVLESCGKFAEMKFIFFGLPVNNDFEMKKWNVLKLWQHWFNVYEFTNDIRSSMRIISSQILH